MSFIDTVRAKRMKLADVLADEEYSGIREIVEELYPDQAHFIYELLQNAEDAGASNARFVLEKKRLCFEHDGRAFSEDDVWGITNIGKGGKRDQEDKIGRFGVGFKSVFAYTETPHIWSPSFSFKISHLVLPTELGSTRDLGGRTRFEFPFDGAKKSASAAYSETKAGLEDLAESTLLFLTNLHTVCWQIGQDMTGELRRIEHSPHHIEVRKRTGKARSRSAHYLRFSESVKGLEKQRVAIAFELECLPTANTFDPKKPLLRQMKIAPARPGRVAVYFPAEKETSGLRFHLHAPFVPELSRASVKNTSANKPLFKQLAELAASCLFTVRDLKLLTSDFLSVLPNLEDDLPMRYECIRAAIIDAMNNEPLTPTHSKSFAPAKYLLQAKASFKELFTSTDLRWFQEMDLITDHEESLDWAVGASQKNSNADRFLSGLEITDWGIDEFVELLEYCHENVTPWLRNKLPAWHLKLYSLLYRELEPEFELNRLEDTPIILLSDGSYSVGRECSFPADHGRRIGRLPFVAKDVYLSGNSKSQQKAAREFLEALGVRELGVTEQVEAILKLRYTYDADAPEEKSHIRDLGLFIRSYESDNDTATSFEDYYILLGADRCWYKPSSIYLDRPFVDTGLSAYYGALGDKGEWSNLSELYLDCGLKVERIVRFATAVGAHKRLEIEEQSTNRHPQEERLRGDYYNGDRRWTRSGTDEDWTITDLDELFNSPSLALSRLVWNTMVAAHREVLRARFRPNRQTPIQEAPSSLVLMLRELPWVPQGNGEFVVPRAASRSKLPKGFPFDEGYEWLKAIEFGEDIRQQSEENRKRQSIAKGLGFEDHKSLEDAQWFAKLSEDERRQFRVEYERRHSFELPENETRDPNSRAARVRQQSVDAPNRETERRTRSVSVNREDVKADAEQYLRQQYTNADGEMICQICKVPLPFKLDDDSYYVEKVEFLPELERRHYQNYLALCPNHAAMFQHTNGSRDENLGMFLEMEGNELNVELARQAASIYFTKTHATDLRAVIESEQQNRDGHVPA